MEDKMIIDLADIPPVPIVLGLAGENNFRSFTFDASTWGAGYPSARYNVVYKRPDGYLYPVVLNADTDELVWSPNATDTAVNGDALVEVRLLQGDVVGKTVAMQAIVLPSISGDESEPDKPAPDWVNDVSDDADRAEAAVEHYPQIRNGYWWVWDVANDEWVNTGVKATGEGGGAVESVNGMTGKVTVKTPLYLTYDSTTNTVDKTPAEIDALSAAGNDVHIRYPYNGVAFDVRYNLLLERTTAAFSTGIGNVVMTVFVSSNKTVSSLSFDIQDALDGKADKSEIPTVPQMATQADMSDWTSGKTVDAALLKTNFTSAARQLSWLSDDVQNLDSDKADKSEIPTDNNQLMNGAGYQTAAQVQAAISGVRQLPTGGSTGDFLRKDSNGNAAWETVSTWQGGSY